MALRLQRRRIWLLQDMEVVTSEGIAAQMIAQGIRQDMIGRAQID
ncbi:MAG: hypothetical protein ABJ013_16170 [Halioglobus sp.]